MTLTPIAVHESAHAIIAGLFGLPLIRATLDPPRCTYDWRQIRKSARVELGYLVSTLAAREAEIELIGDDTPLASANDEMKVREILQKRGLDADKYVSETRLLARRLVRLHAPVIERGARVLKSFGFMTASDVAKILGAAGEAVGYRPVRVLQIPPDDEPEHGEPLPDLPAPIITRQLTPSIFDAASNHGTRVAKRRSAIGASNLFDRVRGCRYRA